MYEGNPKKRDFGLSLHEVRVSEGSSYQEWTAHWVCKPVFFTICFYKFAIRLILTNKVECIWNQSVIWDVCFNHFLPKKEENVTKTLGTTITNYIVKLRTHSHSLVLIVTHKLSTPWSPVYT